VEQPIRTQLGLAEDEPCEILVVGSAAFCSFIKARLARLGCSSRVGITSGQLHAQDAIRAERPWITVIDLNLNVRSGGMDLASTIQNENLETSIVLLATRFDDRSLRDLAYKMRDDWSVVARRVTDNGDPLELAMDAARAGSAWIDSSIREELAKWRTSPGKLTPVVDRQPVG
jgi:DNA-binding NarL/FixJ family response regulator